MSEPLTVVVLSGGRIPDPGSLAVARQLRDRGVQVSLISRQVPTPEQRALFDRAHVLGRGPAEELPAPGEEAAVAAIPRQRPPLPRLVIRRVQLDIRRARRAGRRAVMRARRASRGRLLPPGPPRLDAELRRDPVGRDLVAKADLVVALDRAGIRVAWRQSRRTGAGAVLGLAAATWWLDHR